MRRSKAEMARLGTDAVLNRGKSAEEYQADLEHLDVASFDEAWIMAAVATLGTITHSQAAHSSSRYVQLGNDLYVPATYDSQISKATMLARARSAKNLKPNRGLDSPRIITGQVRIFPAPPGFGDAPHIVRVLPEVPRRNEQGFLDDCAKAEELRRLIQITGNISIQP